MIRGGGPVQGHEAEKEGAEIEAAQGAGNEGEEEAEAEVEKEQNEEVGK